MYFRVNSVVEASPAVGSNRIHETGLYNLDTQEKLLYSYTFYRNKNVIRLQIRPVKMQQDFNFKMKNYLVFCERHFTSVSCVIIHTRY